MKAAIADSITGKISYPKNAFDFSRNAPSRSDFYTLSVSNNKWFREGIVDVNELAADDVQQLEDRSTGVFGSYWVYYLEKIGLWDLGKGLEVVVSRLD